jgi:hypothetical protein
MRIHLIKEGSVRKGMGSFPVRDERGTPVLIDRGGKLTVLPPEGAAKRFTVIGEIEALPSTDGSIVVQANSESERSSGLIVMELPNGKSYEILVFAGNWTTRPARPEYPRIGEIADGYIVSAPELGIAEIEAL